MTAKAQATSWNHTTRTYGMSDASLCWLLYISEICSSTITAKDG